MPWASMTARICGKCVGQWANGELCGERAYALLELSQISRAQGIRLRDDRNQIDARAETFHNLNIKRLERVTSRANEVQASMHSQIDLLGPTRLLLLQHVALMLIVKKLDDGLPAVPIVHVVAETWRIDDGESDFEELLFQLRLGDLDLHRLVDLLGVAAAVVGVVLDGG